MARRVPSAALHFRCRGVHSRPPDARRKDRPGHPDQPSRYPASIRRPRRGRHRDTALPARRPGPLPPCCPPPRTSAGCTRACPQRRGPSRPGFRRRSYPNPRHAATLRLTNGRTALATTSSLPAAPSHVASRVGGAEVAAPVVRVIQMPLAPRGDQTTAAATKRPAAIHDDRPPLAFALMSRAVAAFRGFSRLTMPQESPPFM